jgi:hypothetical protein
MPIYYTPYGRRWAMEFKINSLKTTGFIILFMEEIPLIRQCSIEELINYGIRF